MPQVAKKSLSLSLSFEGKYPLKEFQGYYQQCDDIILIKRIKQFIFKWDSLFTETLKRLPAQTNKQNLGPMYSSGIIQKHSSRQMSIGPWKGRPCEAQWLCFACFAEDSSLEDMPVQSSRATSAQPQPQILVFAHDVLINL